ncbi:MAG: purine biosynthesis protein PurH [Saccharofermentans sp.]|nr:purine biosynthesis protein PurH [Saccharofermentans sp.]
MLDKYLIKNTTMAERKEIVNESLGITYGSCDSCMQGIIDMYDAYIYGEKELHEINAEFAARTAYVKDDDMDGGPTTCPM